MARKRLKKMHDQYEDDDQIFPSIIYDQNDGDDDQGVPSTINDTNELSYDGLLKDFEQNQVLIIVGDTSPIPRYLHENGFTKTGKIVCTQPRRAAVMRVSAYVAEEMGVKLGNEVGYTIRFENYTSHKTIIKCMTDGMLLRELLSDQDLLGSYRQEVARFRPELKVLISSATLDVFKFSDYFDSAPIWMSPHRQYPVRICHTMAPQADDLDAAIVTVLRIHVTESPEDILLFLIGQEDIETAEELLNHRTRGLGRKIKEELIICSIHANLATDLQKIFEPTPVGSRKVVLASNVAETSLMMDDIKFVIDPGLMKLRFYNPQTGRESLVVVPISKASATLRAHRSGRIGPGKCFRLYTSYQYHHGLDNYTAPEIKRCNLATVVLFLKRLGVHDLLNFDYMDSPPSIALMKALDLLYVLGALNIRGEVTEVGQRMAEFPVDPMLAKVIVASEKYKCSEDIITIAAMISVGSSIFCRPKDKRATLRFYEGNMGDHIALLKIYNDWKACSFRRMWCSKNYVKISCMERARMIRGHLERLLKRVNIEVTSSLNDLEAIQKAIAARLFPNCSKLELNGLYRTVKHPMTVYIHPASGLSELEPPARWLVYSELVSTTKDYMRQVTPVKPEWLPEVAPRFYSEKEVGRVLQVSSGKGRQQ